MTCLSPSGLHLLQVFVDKPLSEASPEEDEVPYLSCFYMRIEKPNSHIECSEYLLYIHQLNIKFECLVFISWLKCFWHLTTVNRKWTTIILYIAFLYENFKIYLLFSIHKQMATKLPGKALPLHQNWLVLPKGSSRWGKKELVSQRLEENMLC